MKLPTHVSDAVRKRNPEVFAAGGKGIRAARREHAEPGTLERKASGEEKGRVASVGRTRIRFTVFSRRPVDWDGAYVKILQDLLIEIGVLDGDEWDILEGSVVSEKARSVEEERIEVEVIRP